MSEYLPLRYSVGELVNIGSSLAGWMDRNVLCCIGSGETNYCLRT